ncbi:hypothetical protein ACHAQH_002763 [Verticillium albo-atrum]
MSDTLVPKVLGVTSVLVAIITLSVSIRFFVRCCLLRRLDWDDGSKLQMVTPIAYIWGFVTVKMSFAVLYLRLLPDLLNRRINKGLLVLLLAEGIEESLVIIFHCVPMAKVWNHSLEGECLDLKPFYYASVNIICGTVRGLQLMRYSLSSNS